MAAVLPDPTSPFGARVHNRLRDEQVIWFTAVADDGTPQPNPVWFVWQDDAVLVYNKRGARRLDYLRERPRVALHFNGDQRGADIIVLTGVADVLDDAQPPHVVPAYLEKYRRSMIGVSGSLEAFSEAYPTAVRVRPTLVRGF
jgi:PPOX class probable F420-dependent enzyme